ncbi:MAG: type II CAAX endopeptidase family protein [Candidatus Latescibacterota bacterium]
MERQHSRLTALLLVLGAAGLVAFLSLYEQAFPVASLDFRIDREQAVQRAEEYLTQRGWSTAGYRRAQVLANDAEAQVFLERTVGLEEANRLAREWVSVWRWQVRWFTPLVKEELRVGLDPGGRVVAFAHLVLESDPGAHLSQTEALPLAEQFLRAEAGVALDDFELIERSSEEREARVDHTFTYRKRGFTVGEDGHYRLEVVVQGDQVGSFREYLKVPEAFSRRYNEVRSRAGLLSSVAGTCWLALGVAMLVVLVQKHRQRALRWRVGVAAGIAVLAASVAAHLNSLPLYRFGYDTTESYTSFLGQLLAVGLLQALVVGGLIALVGTAGEGVGREVLFAGQRSPFAGRGPRQALAAAGVRGTLAGYGMAGAMLGYVTLFYLVGARYFGVWSPADVVDYSNAFSTTIPWIYPLLVGMAAATTEEFFFRLLAIPLLLRWLGRRWLAVLLPAVIWGFLHSNYPVEPIYTRGIELTAMGVVLGLIFLRFGIWSTIVAHYAYDAFVVSIPMLRSASPYYQISGILVVGLLLVPVVPGLVARLRGASPASEEPGEPQAPEPAPEAQLAAAPGLQPTVVRQGLQDYALDARRRRTAAIVALAGLLVALAVPVTQFGERTLRLSVTRSQAVAAAEAYCRELGLDLQGYRRATWFTSALSSDAYVHLVRQAGPARADTLASEETAPWLWTMRWVKPQQKEEIRVGVDAAGRVAYLDHLLPESQPGPALEPAEARAIVESFVEKQFGRTVTDTSRYRLLESRAEKREARQDHHFVWERVDRKVADGEFRTSVRLQGDQVGLVHLAYKAPEEFLRKLQERTAKDVVPVVAVIGVMVATLVLAGVFFFRLYRDGQVTWKLGVRMGILSSTLMLLDKVNELPKLYQEYDTSQALGTYLGQSLLGVVVSSLCVGLSVTVAVALAVALFRTLHPGEMEPDRWFGLLRPGTGSRRLWCDVVLLAACLWLAGEGLDRMGTFVKYRWLMDYLRPADVAPRHLDVLLPALAALSTALMMLPLVLIALGAFLIWQRALRRPWLLGLGIAAVAIATGAVDPAEDWRHFALLLPMVLISLALPLWIVVRVVRFNLAAYVVVLSVGGLLEHGWSLVTSGHALYQSHGVLMLVLGLGPLVLLLLSAGRREPRGEPSVAG